MLTAGVDVGSLTTKAVVLEDGRWLASALRITGASSQQNARLVLDEALAACGRGFSELDAIVATGYGRISVPFPARTVTEITCHARGAWAEFTSTRTVIDVGGQDSKVIRVEPPGRVVDFAMNDKCAAGTGRFLEVMARALELELEEMAQLSLRARHKAAISSTCTVFAESEVVSLIAQGRPRDEIVRGLHEAVCDRLFGLIARVGAEPQYTMTGGVAKNRGLLTVLEARLRSRINVPQNPQLAGAYGAALIAWEQARA
ncbi:MAG TPA: 2-hydroxyglutaryl-CoA dehydratase [Firmicutes bacterium]|nr:2-hydroxyglutaryl-CoA dehydratase [Bacillota bacterium]